MKIYTKKSSNLILAKIVNSLKKKKSKSSITYPNIKGNQVIYHNDILFPASILIDIYGLKNHKHKIIGKIEICLSTINPLYSIRKFHLNDPEEHGLYRGHNKLTNLYESFDIIYNEIMKCIL